MRKITVLLQFVFAITQGLASDYGSDERGYYDAPYTRYEANEAHLKNATILKASFDQSKLQSEASQQVCVDMTKPGASAQWTLREEGDGMVIRYSLPDKTSGVLDVFADDKIIGSIELTTHWSWEYLAEDDNSNNNGVVNKSPKMRFDEVRMKLPEVLAKGQKLKLVTQSGLVTIDFVELEKVPEVIKAQEGDVVYDGSGSDLRSFIANVGAGKTVYVGPGKYDIPGDLYFGHAGTSLKGAGSWYTQLHFVSQKQWNGGLLANAADISYSGLFLTTVRNSRSNTYKGINGVYTKNSTITDVWAEHFECGAWIANYVGGPVKEADGFVMSHCRFRNNYADGINLCKGTSNAIVEHCSFRNNGDDDMAIWCANDQACINNTYRYNTSENCWRASGCAIYGGKNNTAHHLLIRDNLEVGLRVNNAFPGVGFMDEGHHEFYDITIIRCGTQLDLFNEPVGAIDIVCTSVAGDAIENVRFARIAILESRHDAVFLKKTTGEGFKNIDFQDIAIDRVGVEHGQHGVGVRIIGNPSGLVTYHNLQFKNLKENKENEFDLIGIGSLRWVDSNSLMGFK